MREWISDRPGLVAVVALLAPVLLGAAGLGVASLVPDIHLASRAAPQFSLHVPSQPTVAPLPRETIDQVVPPGRAQIRVPILEYHYIRVNPDPKDQLGFNLSVTPANFLAQMDWLKASGYHPIDLTTLRRYFANKTALPGRPVVLTFDDGYDDFYGAALPVLVDHGFTAVSYVVPGFLNRPRYMTTDEVKAIDAAGIEVGAHTMHHVDLTKASAPDLMLEIQGSREVLEQMVGHPVLDFCYPSGKYDARVVAETERAGFQSATTEVPGTAHDWAGRLTWSRTRVNGGEDLQQFVASLGDPEPTIATSPSASPDV